MSTIQYINIFQIGETVLHLHNKIDAPYKAESDIQFSSFLHSPRKINPDGRGIYKDRSINIEGIVHEFFDVAPHQQLGQLMSYLGDTIPIIGYIVHGGTFKNPCRCACESCINANDITWVMANGFVEAVDGDVVDGKTFFELDMDITLISNWQPLNPYLWTWSQNFANESIRPRNNDPNGTENYRKQAACPPKAKQLFNILKRKSCQNYKFNYRTLSMEGLKHLLYDFSFWLSTDTGCFCHGYDKEILGCVWQNGQNTFHINIDKGTWSAPPKLLWGFSNLPTEGTLIGRITTQGNMQPEEYVVEIDLVKLNTDITDAGFTQLNTTELIFGDISRYEAGEQYRPAFVRDAFGNLLNGVHPKISYPRQFPTMINTGESFISWSHSAGQDFILSYVVIPQRV